jgi:hypothetical protein
MPAPCRTNWIPQRGTVSELTQSVDALQVDLEATRTVLRWQSRSAIRRLADLAAAGNSSGAVPVGCPDFDARAARTVGLTGSFLQTNTPSYRLNAGGGAPLASCPNTTGRGYVSEAPSISLLLSEMSTETGWLQFSVTASCDTTLLINTPTTIWYFDDDSNGQLQPRLMIPNIEAFNGTEGGGWMCGWEPSTKARRATPRLRSRESRPAPAASSAMSRADRCSTR